MQDDKILTAENKISRDLYEQSKKFIDKDIDAIRFIKDNFCLTVTECIYRHHFENLTDHSSIMEYAEAGAKIYLDLFALNKRLRNDYDGDFDEYLLRLISDRFFYCFDNSKALLRENTDSLADKFKAKLPAIAKPCPTAPHKKLSAEITVKKSKAASKTIFITGALGFIGKNCIDYFMGLPADEAEAPYKICVLTSQTSDYKALPDGITYYHGSVNDPLIYERILLENEVDYVIHLAAIPIVDDAKSDPQNTLDINTQSINVLCSTILQNHIPVRGIIFPSTEQVYAGSQSGLKESAVINDTLIESTYAYFKFLAERLAIRYARQGLPVIITRLSNVYGEYDTHITNRLIPRTIDLLSRGQSPVLFIDKDSKMSARLDFLYVGDLVRAFHLILRSFENPEFAYDKNDMIYNIGSGEGHSVDEIQKLLMAIMHKETAVRAEEGTLVCRGIMDVEKIRKKLGFTAQVPLKEGLERTVIWYKNSRQEAPPH